MPFASGSTVTPVSAGWRYVGFEVLKLGAGARLSRQAGSDEHCLVAVAGHMRVNGWELGGRATPFDGPPHAAYLAPGTGWELEALSDLELAVCTAPAREGAESRPLRDPRFEARGSGPTARRIHHILMEEQPAERLLVTEVVTPGGNWSSYPPHKHDTEDPPGEAYLEETYYHRFLRPEGFGIQRVYTADRALDEALVVKDGDIVLVPRGYHPVAAAAGYDLYYLNVMAGPNRRWLVRWEPAHEWLR